MPDLAVIEGRDPHEDSRLKRNIVSALGVETPRHSSASARKPSGRTSDIRAIAREFAGDETPGTTAPRDAGILFRRIRYRFRLRHEPACSVALAMIWIDVDLPHRCGCFRKILGTDAA